MREYHCLSSNGRASDSVAFIGDELFESEVESTPDGFADRIIEETSLSGRVRDALEEYLASLDSENE